MTLLGEFIPNLRVAAGSVSKIWDEFSAMWGL